MLYQFDGDQTIRVSGTDGSSLKMQALSMNGARAYYGGTVDWRIDDSWRMYGQLSREEGSGYTKDYDVSIALVIDDLNLLPVPMRTQIGWGAVVIEAAEVGINKYKASSATCRIAATQKRESLDLPQSA